MSSDAYEALRIERAFRGRRYDIDEKTIPQEAFLERDAVSFTKGCFLGQELVCRIDSARHVNRFLRRFTSIDGDWPAAGAEIVVGDKVVGTLTSVAALPSCPPARSATCAARSNRRRRSSCAGTEAQVRRSSRRCPRPREHRRDGHGAVRVRLSGVDRR